MNIKKWFTKQYILLTFSIILGLLVIVLGSSYAYYVITITGSDTNNNVAVKITNLNLDISNVTGNLSLCKSYPITTTDGLKCTPYKFTLTNNNKVSVDYYLNFEMTSGLPKEAFRVAFATCSDTSCSSPTYNTAKLSEMVDNPDTALTKYTGELLTAGSTSLKTGESKTFSVIYWIDQDFEKDDSNYDVSSVTATIAAIAYTEDPNNLTFTASFDLENQGTWTTSTCKSSDGYTISGTKCVKTFGVKNTYGTLPTIASDDLVVTWYEDRSKTTTVTSSTGYILKSNPVHYAKVVNTALPTCSLTLSNGNIVATTSGKYDRTYYGWSSAYSGTNTTSKAIVTGSSTYYVKDSKGSTNTCSIDVVNVTVGSKTVTEDTRIGYNEAATGRCTCKHTYFDSSGHQQIENYAGTCSLPSGTCTCSKGGAKISGNCSSTTSIYYYCNEGFNKVDNKTCTKTEPTYSCPTGYTNYSNSYCYKV